MTTASGSAAWGEVDCGAAYHWVLADEKEEEEEDDNDDNNDNKDNKDKEEDNNKNTARLTAAWPIIEYLRILPDPSYPPSCHPTILMSFSCFE